MKNHACINQDNLLLLLDRLSQTNAENERRVKIQNTDEEKHLDVHSSKITKEVKYATHEDANIKPVFYQYQCDTCNRGISSKTALD